MIAHCKHCGEAIYFDPQECSVDPDICDDCLEGWWFSSPDIDSFGNNYSDADPGL